MKVKIKVILTRNPYGVRPLYICRYKNHNISFCSDVSPMLLDNNILSLQPFSPGTYQEFVYLNGAYLSERIEKYFYCDSLVHSVPMNHKNKPIQYYMINLLRKLQNGIKKRVENYERDIVYYQEV